MIAVTPVTPMFVMFVMTAGLGCVAFVLALTVLRRFSGAVYFAVAVFSQGGAFVIIAVHSHASNVYPLGVCVYGERVSDVSG